jgi:A/G-specific adenine glycosylase
MTEPNHFFTYEFSPRLLAWYERNKRELPWRETSDPYKIWLSEIILQQTRVMQGLPYYKDFVSKYPTIIDLARASEQEVLRLWQGLGYYSRARNMLHTAQIIAFEKNGVFPDNYEELLKLKGIGSYTAAAIASFAFREKVAVLDGNVFRVLARVFGISTDILSHEAKKIFSAKANSLISEDKPDIFNQAMMELGALVCTPQSPDCLLCPFSEDCVACLTGKQQEFPVKIKKTKVRKRFFHYLIFEIDDQFALKERTSKDIWQGLYDFYLLESDDFKPITNLADTVLTQLLTGAEVEVSDEVFTHQLTHQRIFTKFWLVYLKNETQQKAVEQLGLQFYSLEEINHLPKPILIDKYMKLFN